MKQIILVIALVMGMAGLCNAAEDMELTNPEVRPPITKYRIESVNFNLTQRTVVIHVLKGYLSEGAFVEVSDLGVTITPSEFTTFVQGIGIDKAYLKSVIKTKFKLVE